MFIFVNDGKGKWQSWECHARIPYDGADSFEATTYGETEKEARDNMADLIAKAVCAMNSASDILTANPKAKRPDGPE